MADGPNRERDERDADLLRALATFPSDVARMLEGQASEALRQPGSDGGWGVVEHLCHLRDWEAIVSERVQAIAERDRPTIEEVDVALWDIERSYREQDPGKALAAFEASRADTVGRLGALPLTAWERTGRHPSLGSLSLRRIAEQTRDHDAEHLALMRDALG